MKPSYKIDRGAGIYMFTNRVNGKRYVGQSRDMYTRFYKHQADVKTGKMILYKAINKHGFYSFDWEVLEYLPNATKQELNEREQYWILHHRSNERSLGYNRMTPLNCPLKKDLALEHLEKANKTNQEKGNPFKGKTHSAYSRLAMSNRHRERTLSPEEKQAISDRQQGKDNHFYGKTHRRESIDKANYSRTLQRFFNPAPIHNAVYIKLIYPDGNSKCLPITEGIKELHIDREDLHKKIKSNTPLRGIDISYATKQDVADLCEQQRLTNMASILGTPTYW